MAHRRNYPQIPEKITQKYPIELKGKCPLCNWDVEFLYNSAPKLIYQLLKPIEIRYDLYSWNYFGIIWKNMQIQFKITY